MRVMRWLWTLLLPAAACALDASRDVAEVTVAMDGAFDFAVDESLLELNATADESPDGQTATIVIGVKTDVLRGGAARQAIRETWGRSGYGVRVLFIGCRPTWASLGDAERLKAQQAILEERSMYQDLLVEELRCQDTPEALVEKTIEFLHFAYTRHPLAAFAMVTDDSVFVRRDRLIQFLTSDSTPRERFYAGNTPTPAYRDVSPVHRDPQSPYYLSEDDYPMSELPPFLDGAHYIVSRDIMEFISINRDDLQGFRGLDDVTMALWMLALQVHPVFLEDFAFFGVTCPDGDWTSLAQLTPDHMRRVHANLVDSLRPCLGFQMAGDWASTVTFRWDLQHDPHASSLRIAVTMTPEGSGNAVELFYVPSSAPYEEAFCNALRSVFPRVSPIMLRQLCEKHARSLLPILTRDDGDAPGLRPRLVIAHHNVARYVESADPAQRIVIGLSRSARYARVVIECLFVEMHPDKSVVVVNEEDLQGSMPDVMLFSILDEPAKHVLEIPFADAPPVGQYFIDKYAGRSQLMMISGETYPLKDLDPRVILLTYDLASNQPKHLYLPVVSTAFGESIRHSPLQLVRPLESIDPHPKTQFCAYLYARCDRPAREYMYDLLNDAEPVDALGVCQGARRPPLRSRFASRISVFYIDDAVAKYKDYKFVIAFENTIDAPGYVTEKILTAFLAGAVPVYFGHASSVSRLFNPRAFINCGVFESLRACARHVLAVHSTPELYEAMRREPPVVDAEAFADAFSWHPEVVEWMQQQQQQERRMSRRLQELMGSAGLRSQ